MKTFAFFSLLLSSLAISPAHAEVREHVLDSVVIDGQETKYVAQLQIDTDAKEIEVKIFDDMCGYFAAKPGIYTCLAMPRLVRSFSAELTDFREGCGSGYFTGFRDQTPVDGPRTEIAVVDHTTRRCRDLPPFRVQVKASVYNPWSQKNTEFLLTKTNSARY
jgi:hypothetical protein